MNINNIINSKINVLRQYKNNIKVYDIKWSRNPDFIFKLGTQKYSKVKKVYTQISWILWKKVDKQKQKNNSGQQ